MNPHFLHRTAFAHLPPPQIDLCRTLMYITTWTNRKQLLTSHIPHFQAAFSASTLAGEQLLVLAFTQLLPAPNAAAPLAAAGRFGGGGGGAAGGASGFAVFHLYVRSSSPEITQAVQVWDLIFIPLFPYPLLFPFCVHSPLLKQASLAVVIVARSDRIVLSCAVLCCAVQLHSSDWLRDLCGGAVLPGLAQPGLHATGAPKPPIDARLASLQRAFLAPPLQPVGGAGTGAQDGGQQGTGLQGGAKVGNVWHVCVGSMFRGRGGGDHSLNISDLKSVPPDRP